MSALHELDLWLCEEVHFNIHRLLVRKTNGPNLKRPARLNSQNRNSIAESGRNVRPPR